jgi:hypothetical protein
VGGVAALEYQADDKFLAVARWGRCCDVCCAVCCAVPCLLYLLIDLLAAAQLCAVR